MSLKKRDSLRRRSISTLKQKCLITRTDSYVLDSDITKRKKKKPASNPISNTYSNTSIYIHNRTIKCKESQTSGSVNKPSTRSDSGFLTSIIRWSNIGHQTFIKDTCEIITSYVVRSTSLTLWYVNHLLTVNKTKLKGF